MFRTVVEITPEKNKISYEDQLLTIGSCFSENIGGRLKSAFFSVDINPFGVLFNPVSIKNSLEKLIDKKNFSEEDIFKHGSLWSSFSHSTLFSSVDQRDCLQKINERIEVSSTTIGHARFLLITFGTAWVFESNETREVVSNCHKLPSNNFTRRRLRMEEIVETYDTLLSKLHQLNPLLQIIFTVSPIRHWKDGAHENNISKSILLMAIDTIKEQFDFVSYFPAYEIQLDELRDYRFYESDMFHPSDTAIEYIWKRFSETYFSEETQAIKTELEQLTAQLKHRSINPDSQENKAFIQSLEKKKELLKQKYPFLNKQMISYQG
jgi:hypothetical protein